MVDVRIEGLTKRFPGGVTAIDDLDLTIEDQEFFALLGPSGCGKTTLLRTVAGLEQPTAGRIELDGRDVTRLPPGERDVAMVFQDYALYPHMQVVDNIAYPLKVRKVGKSTRRDRAAEAAHSLQLGELLGRRPAELSGGQQQRVAVARAIAYQPSLFLFDEPLSNLDARLRLEARTFLKRLQAELGVSTVYVTHDQSEALALSDRMAVMKNGKIRQIGSPAEVFTRPSELFVAGFIGSVPMNLLDAEVDADGRLRLGNQALPLPSRFRDAVRQGDRVVLGARPEYCRLVGDDHDGGTLRGEVVVSEFLGTQQLVTVESEALTVQVVSDRSPRLGERVSIGFDDDHALLYGAQDGRLLTAAARAAAPEVQP